VPAANDCPRCGRSVNLSCDGRPAVTLRSFPGGRRACRPDAKTLPVRRDRLRRRGVQMWRRPATHDALRGRTFTAYPEQEMVVAEGAGRASRSATRDASGDRRGRQAVAVVLHRMGVDGSEFRWSKDSTAVPVVA
jgi:hypothetical protein